jgi:hypothetical protein
MQRHPNVSGEKLARLFMTKILGDEAMTAIENLDEAEAVFEYFTTNHGRSIERYEPATPEAYIERSEARAEVRKERIEATKKAAAAVAQIILLNLPMPNGKTLRDCTFREVAKFGSSYTKLSAMGKPMQKVGILTEDRVRSAFQ